MTEENKQLAPAQEAKMSFIIDSKKHNLTKLHKELDKHTMEAVQYLASVLSNPDADVDQKMKAAKDITDFKLICEYCDIMGIELNLTFEIT